jgi:hypothetical protein
VPTSDPGSKSGRGKTKALGAGLPALVAVGAAAAVLIGSSHSPRKTPRHPAATVPGDTRAHATRLDPAAAESTDVLAAVSYQGDIGITMTVTSTAPPSTPLLAKMLSGQYERLRAAAG